MPWKIIAYGLDKYFNLISRTKYLNQNKIKSQLSDKISISERRIDIDSNHFIEKNIDKEQTKSRNLLMKINMVYQIFW